jgi:hypothetical protein
LLLATSPRLCPQIAFLAAVSPVRDLQISSHQITHSLGAISACTVAPHSCADLFHAAAELNYWSLVEWVGKVCLQPQIQGNLYTECVYYFFIQSLIGNV